MHIVIEDYIDLLELVKSAAANETKKKATEEEIDLLYSLPSLWLDALTILEAETSLKLANMESPSSTSHLDAEAKSYYVRTNHFRSSIRVTKLYVDSYFRNKDNLELTDDDVAEYLENYQQITKSDLTLKTQSA